MDKNIILQFTEYKIYKRVKLANSYLYRNRGCEMIRVAINVE